MSSKPPFNTGDAVRLNNQCFNYPAGSVSIVKSCWWSDWHGWRVTLVGGQVGELSLQAYDVTLVNAAPREAR